MNIDVRMVLCISQDLFPDGEFDCPMGSMMITLVLAASDHVKMENVFEIA